MVADLAFYMDVGYLHKVERKWNEARLFDW